MEVAALQINDIYMNDHTIEEKRSRRNHKTLHMSPVIKRILAAILDETEPRIL